MDWIEMNVLLVEDDNLVGPLLEITIEDAGHEVTSVDSGETALRYVVDGTFDVLVSEVGLPGINGTELARKARQIDPTLWIILIGGDPDVAVLEFLPRATYVRKPFPPESLEGILASLHVGDADPGAQR